MFNLPFSQFLAYYKLIYKFSFIFVCVCTHRYSQKRVCWKLNCVPFEECQIVLITQLSPSIDWLNYFLNLIMIRSCFPFFRTCSKVWTLASPALSYEMQSWCDAGSGISLWSVVIMGFESGLCFVLCCAAKLCCWEVRLVSLELF